MMGRSIISLLLLVTALICGVHCSLSPRSMVRSYLPHRSPSKLSTLSFHNKQTHIMSYHIMDDNNTTISPNATFPPNNTDHPTTATPTNIPTNAAPTNSSTTITTPTTGSPTTQGPTTGAPTTTEAPTPTTSSPTTQEPTDNTTTTGPIYPYNPSPLITTQIISSGDVYNGIGNKLYYPNEFTMLEDFRELRSSVILEMVETGWNNNTLVVLENTLMDPIAFGEETTFIRLYLVFQNGSRQEILQDYWILNIHPWYLGQTIGFNRDVSPTTVVLTFEGRVAGEDPNELMYLGFYILDLNVSYDRMIAHSPNQTTPTSLVTPFQIVQQQEPTYFEDGTVNNAARIIHPIDTLVVSQSQNILNYQLKPVPAVHDGVNNWPAGYLLLIRFRYFGGIRLIRYTDDIHPIYQTLLIPEIVNPHLPNDYSELTPTVGYVQVDRDGHIYVLIDIGQHEIPTVTHYHRTLLGSRTTQSSILFLLDHTGTILRADWVPISYPSLIGQLTTSITVQEGDGRVAITHIGITSDNNEIASLIEYLDYNMTLSSIPSPQSSAAMILTLPPMIRNDCVIPSKEVSVYAVTALSTPGDYAIAGTHGYAQRWDDNGNPYTIYPGTSFVAILNLDHLLTNGYTNLYVNNFGVRNRDNIATNLIATSDGGFFVGTQLDRYIPYNEKNDSMKYETTTIFHVKRSMRVCDPAKTSSGWVTCGVEMCLSWCSALTPQAIDVNVNIIPDAQCDVKNNVPPIQLPSVGDNGDGSSHTSSSSDNARSIGLGVGLGLGLGGVCLLLACFVCYRRKYGTTTRHAPLPMEGVGERQLSPNVAHQPLTEELPGGEGNISPSAGFTGV